MAGAGIWERNHCMTFIMVQGITPGREEEAEEMKVGKAGAL